MFLGGERTSCTKSEVKAEAKKDGGARQTDGYAGAGHIDRCRIDRITLLSDANRRIMRNFKTDAKKEHENRDRIAEKHLQPFAVMPNLGILLIFKEWASNI